MSVSKYAPQLSKVYLGVAADTKPSAAIGDKFLETDDLKVFIYTGAAWVQIGVYSTTTAPPVVI